MMKKRWMKSILKFSPLRNWITRRSIASLVLFACSFCATAALLAKGPPPGKGGGGDDSSTTYSVTDLAGNLLQSYADAISAQDENGIAYAAANHGPSGSYAGVWTISSAGERLAFDDITVPSSSLPDQALVTSLRAEDINVTGTLVGRLTYAIEKESSTESSSEPFVDIPSDGTRLLPTLGDGGTAAAINDSGTIVGSVDHPEGSGSGAVWYLEADGTVSGPVDLGSFFPADVNSFDVMVGSIREPEMPWVAAIAWFDAAGDLRVNSLGLFSANHRRSHAIALNDSEEVVGVSRSSDDYVAFYWNQEDGMQAISPKGTGGKWPLPRDINALGQVVGLVVANPSYKAFLWETGTAYDLNKLVDIEDTLIEAAGINDMGQIVGTLRTKHTHEDRGMLLTPSSP